MTPPGEEPPLLLSRFVDRFDRGEYWLAHEELEELWLERREDFYKGLIHLAACLVHARRGNWRGAVTKARSALGYLQAAPTKDFAGFDVESLCERARRLLEHLEALAAGEADQLDDCLLPDLRPLFAHHVAEGLAEPEKLPYRARRHEQGYRLGRDPVDRD